MIVLWLFYTISVLLTYWSNKRNLKILFVFIVALISAISFFYVPSESADLSRHFETIVLYGDMGLEWVTQNRFDINPLTSLLFYAFSFIGDLRWFISFSAFVTYGFTFLLIYKISRYYQLKSSTVALLTMFVLYNWNYLMVVSNCRIFMLYAIIAYLFYEEFIEDRRHKTALIIYLASILFHYGILLVLIPRFFLYLYKPQNKSIYLWMAVVGALLLYLGVSNYQAILFDSISEKVEGYKQYNVFGTWQFLNSLVCILLCCYYSFKNRRLVLEINKYNIAYWLIVLLIFLQISNFQVIYRESNLVASLAIVFFAISLKKEQSNSMKHVIAIQSVFSLVYSFVYVYPHMNFNFVF